MRSDLLFFVEDNNLEVRMFPKELKPYGKPDDSGAYDCNVAIPISGRGHSLSAHLGCRRLQIQFCFCSAQFKSGTLRKTSTPD